MKKEIKSLEEIKTVLSEKKTELETKFIALHGVHTMHILQSIYEVSYGKSDDT